MFLLEIHSKDQLDIKFLCIRRKWGIFIITDHFQAC